MTDYCQPQTFVNRFPKTNGYIPGGTWTPSSQIKWNSVPNRAAETFATSQKVRPHHAQKEKVLKKQQPENVIVASQLVVIS